MSGFAALRPVFPILLGASVILTLSLGLRQSLGIFMPPITKDIGISVSDFTLAIAVQNLAWGVLQPLSGALSARIGFRGIMVAGALFYVAGLVTLASASGLMAVVIGAGVLIGAAMACCGSAIAMSVAARVATAATRSMVMGIVSAAGSLGAMLAAPIGQLLSQGLGWRAGVIGFAVLSAIMLPAAWIAGRADKVPLPKRGEGTGMDAEPASTALKACATSPAFIVMSLAYFVCGMQLVFLTTHLPSYLQICGMDPMLSAQALGFIGAFNILGSLFFGWAGGRWNKLILLGILYSTRSLVLAWYFIEPPTPAGTLVFASRMGFLWLGVGPLIAGAVAEMFGLRWQAMIQGVAFVSHQLGSFMGAYGGGVLYDALGSYELAWRLGTVPEADVRTTKDGVPVAFHDGNFGRLVRCTLLMKQI